MSLELSTELLRELRVLITEVLSPTDLARFATDHLGEQLDNLVPMASLETRAFELVQACRRRGWLERLVDGLAHERSDNSKVITFAERARAGSRDAPAKARRAESGLPPAPGADSARMEADESFAERRAGARRVSGPLLDMPERRKASATASWPELGRVQADVVVITVLPEEYEAALACLVEPRFVPGSESARNTYAWQIGHVPSRLYQTPFCVVVGHATATTTQGALATMEALQRFDPHYVAFVGVAGGFPLDEQRHGDVAVSSAVWAYEYGKVDTGGFAPRHEFTYLCDEGLVRAAGAVRGAQWWRTDDNPDGPPRVRTGPIASGDKVIDDPHDQFFAAVHAAWPKLLAVEMEGAGVGAAMHAAQAKGRAAGFVLVRGISDMPHTKASGEGASTAERDRWKLAAARNAARFLAHLLAEFWPTQPRGDAVEYGSTAPAVPSAAEQPARSSGALTAAARPARRRTPHKLIETVADKVAVRVLIEAVFRIGMSGVTRAGRWLRPNDEAPGSRERLLKSLFLPDDDGHYLLLPSSDWKPVYGQAEPPLGAAGYPHDIAALESFKALVPRETEYWGEATTSLELRPTNGLICTGSAKANNIVRTFLPSIHLERTGERIRCGAQGVEDFPYIFAEDETVPRVKVYSKMHKGRIVEKTRKNIFVKEGNQQRSWAPPAYNDSDWLTSDFLLLSRVPTTNLGGSLLALSGGHGAGTEAVSHLFDGRIHISALKDLVEFLNGERYWQFVLEITSITHKKNGTVANRVVISEDLPPRVLHMNASSLPDTWKLVT